MTMFACAGATFLYAQQQMNADWKVKKEFGFYNASSFFPEVYAAPSALQKTAQTNKRVVQYMHKDSLGATFDQITLKYVGGRPSAFDWSNYTLSVEGPQAGTRFDTLYRESIAGSQVRYINQYDAYGNIVQWTCQSYDSGSGQYLDMAKEAYNWNAQHQLLQREYSSVLGTSWLLQSRTRFSYNSNGLKVSDTSYWYSSSVNRWNVNQCAEYQYNSGNKLIAAKLYTPKIAGSSLLAVSHIVQNTFDGAGMLSTAVYFLFDTAANGMKAMYKDSFGYIGSASIKYLEAMYMDSAKWKKRAYEYRFINSFERADSIDQFGWDKNLSAWKKVSRTRYSYDADHDLVKSIYLSADPVGNFIMDNTVYEEQYLYETFSPSTGVKELDSWKGQVQVYPNPATDKILINNRTLHTLTLNLTDIKGRLVYSGQVQEGKGQVSLQNLSEGLYFVTVYDTEGHSETFKVMKL